MASLPQRMVRAFTLLALGAMVAMLAGCTASSGTLTVQATDAPDNIGDFTSLTIDVSSIEAKSGDGVKSFTPAHGSFDLVKLQAGNLTTLFKDQVPAGNYSKLELVITKATGVLKADGKSVDVKAPKGSIFLPGSFTVEAGKETVFLFDIHVVAKGSGEYSLQPNAGGSKVTKS